MSESMDGRLTAQRLVERSLKAHGAETAVVDGPRRITYSQLRDRTGRLANALMAMGATADRPCATYMPNRAEFIEVDVACMRSGVTRIGIGERLHPSEVVYIMDDSAAAVLVVEAELLERLDLDGCDHLQTVLVVGDQARSRSDRVASYEATLADADPAFSPPSVGLDNPAFVMYTSGTTGRPKGATHTHAGRVASLLNMASQELRLTRRSAMVHAGPMTHGSGSKILSVVAAGGTNVVTSHFDPEYFARVVDAERGTHTFVVPTMIQRLLDAGPEVHETVRKMHGISFGGSPISTTTFASAIERFGPILTQVYGSCEAPHPITLLTPEDYTQEDDPSPALKTAGRPSWGTDIAVGDTPLGKAAPGAAGELHVRGGHVMSGYWRKAKATAEVLDADGWYHTGDLVTVDDRGRIVFQDRKRDLIITGGLNVYPSEVERVIGDHPQVRGVAVLGYPDDQWGESVIAYVVPATANALSESDVIEWTRSRLAAYKKPRRVEFVESLPLGSSNKVLKRELREALWANMDRRVQ